MLDELKDRMKAHQSAIEGRDRSSLEQILDEDYMQLHLYPQRAEYPKRMLMQGFTAYDIKDYEIEDQTIDLDGDCATVFHRHRMAFVMAGVEGSGKYVMTDVWRRRDNSWRLWRRYVTDIPS